MTVVSSVDHLVVAAANLGQGMEWCETVFGIAPAAGGRHALMGTHNLVLAIGSARHPRAYLEIIAIDPAAAPPTHARWFDLDDPALRRSIARQPRLVHFVVACEQAAAALTALRTCGADPGDLVSAERATADGVLRWDITIRRDGHRQLAGALPALIRWSGRHPTDKLPAPAVQLRSFQVQHPQPRAIEAAYQRLGLRDVAVHSGPPDLIATFESPHGTVVLESAGS